MIDFENEEFWIKSLKKSIAKRLIKRNIKNISLINNVCNLHESKFERLINLESSFIKYYDMKKRFEFLIYYINKKYDDKTCMEFIDITGSEVFEVCEGRNQNLMLISENNLELGLYCIGEEKAKMMATKKMKELNYSNETINEIIGDLNEDIDCPQYLDREVRDKMKIPIFNRAIKSKRKEILFKLLQFENNIDNTSIITSMDKNEIEKFIKDNEIFKSTNSETILDREMIEKEIELCELEISIEAIIYADEEYYEDNTLLDYSDEKAKKLFKFKNKFKSKLNKLLKETASQMMKHDFDVEDIIAITGIRWSELEDEYCLRKYKEYLKKES